MQRHPCGNGLLIAALLASAACGQTNLTKYLEQHRQALDLAKFDAKLLDLRDRQVILLGEVHGIAINEDLDLAMLQYLHREAGVRVYVAEFGYSVGLALNAYLRDGDEQKLDFVMRRFEGSPSWTKERRAFYVRLREWNRTLPASERVQFAGLDVEHQGDIALTVLRDLVPGTAPRELRGGTAEEFFASLKTHRAEYESLLGNGSSISS